MINKKEINRIVVKVGTSTLTYDTGKINIRRMSALARVLSDLKNSGREVALVTSGAIGVGVGKLGLIFLSSYSCLAPPSAHFRVSERQFACFL